MDGGDTPQSRNRIRALLRCSALFQDGGRGQVPGTPTPIMPKAGEAH